MSETSGLKRKEILPVYWWDANDPSGWIVIHPDDYPGPLRVGDRVILFVEEPMGETRGFGCVVEVTEIRPLDFPLPGDVEAGRQFALTDYRDRCAIRISVAEASS